MEKRTILIEIKLKKIFLDEGIDWKTWREIQNKKEVKHCLYCGKEIIGKRRHENVFCNSSCAAKYNNSVRAEEIRNKISNTLKKYHAEKNDVPVVKEKPYCLVCGKELTTRRQTCFCCNKCQNYYRYKTYIERWKNGEESGLSGEYGISSHIRRYFLEKYNNKCQMCGWGEINPWTHKAPLEMHHVDGDYTNNKEENLQLLCPNCHSLTENFKAHNKKGRKGREKYY